jgi:hypothetical protein
MEWVRREFLKLAGAAIWSPRDVGARRSVGVAQIPAAAAGTVFDVRSFGATNVARP